MAFITLTWRWSVATVTALHGFGFKKQPRPDRWHRVTAQSGCNLLIADADFNVSPQFPLLLLDRSDTLTVLEVETNAKTVGKKENPVMNPERKYVKIPAPCFHEKSEKVCWDKKMYICMYFSPVSWLVSYFSLLITHIHIQAFRKLFITGLLLCMWGAIFHLSKSSRPFINTNTHIKKQGSDPQPSDWLETHSVSWVADANFFKSTNIIISIRGNLLFINRQLPTSFLLMKINFSDHSWVVKDSKLLIHNCNELILCLLSPEVLFNDC